MYHQRWMKMVSAAMTLTFECVPVDQQQRLQILPILHSVHRFHIAPRLKLSKFVRSFFKESNIFSLYLLPKYSSISHDM